MEGFNRVLQGSKSLVCDRDCTAATLIMGLAYIAGKKRILKIFQRSNINGALLAGAGAVGGLGMGRIYVSHIRKNPSSLETIMVKSCFIVVLCITITQLTAKAFSNKFQIPSKEALKFGVFAVAIKCGQVGVFILLPKQSPLKFNQDALKKLWNDRLDPASDNNAYKQEGSEVLKKRNDWRFTNFGNIGGNPKSRLRFKAPGTNHVVFVEGNWVAPDKFATGFPSGRLIFSSYWFSIGELLKTRPVIIVNLMADRDLNYKFAQFLPLKGPLTVEGEDCLSVRFKHDPLKITLSLKKRTNHGKWYHATVLHEKREISAYCFPTWKDFQNGEVKVVMEMIRAVHQEMAGLVNPAVVCNCRGGVGRTGTFLVCLHFYQMMERGEMDPDLYTPEAIAKVIETFRKERGDAQVVQTDDQFIMLCEMIEIFYNEKLDMSSTIS